MSYRYGHWLPIALHSIDEVNRVKSSPYAQANAGMTKCSNYAHDKALVGGVAVPEPDELLADIMALETWRAQVEKRSGETAKKRKAAPIAVVPATAEATP